ncbi:MAG: hypothetical protein AAB877_03225 [Patescibacteria group bacterium]
MTAEDPATMELGDVVMEFILGVAANTLPGLKNKNKPIAAE